MRRGIPDCLARALQTELECRLRFVAADSAQRPDGGQPDVHVRVFQKGHEERHGFFFLDFSAGSGCFVPYLGIGAGEFIHQDGKPGGIAAAAHGVEGADLQYRLVASVGFPDGFADLRGAE